MFIYLCIYLTYSSSRILSRSAEVRVAEGLKNKGICCYKYVYIYIYIHICNYIIVYIYIYLLIIYNIFIKSDIIKVCPRSASLRVFLPRSASRSFTCLRRIRSSSEGSNQI